LAQQNGFVTIVVVPNTEDGALIVLFRLLTDQAVDWRCPDRVGQRYLTRHGQLCRNDHQQYALGFEPRIGVAEKQLFHALVGAGPHLENRRAG